MKSVIKPLIMGAVIVVSSPVVNAASYSDDKLNAIISSQDDDCNDQVTIKEFTDDNSVYDLNQDGYVTTNEVAIKLEEGVEATVKELRKYGLSETNIDKTVTSELNSISEKSAALVKKMDRDGDSLVEPEELKAFKEKQFKALDHNRDGVISTADLKTKKSSSKGGFGYLYKQ